MKKTLTVNLGGTVFHIDEDAYRLLDNYLCNLKLHFRRQAGADEIVNDIELRISELFLEKLTFDSCFLRNLWFQVLDPYLYHLLDSDSRSSYGG